MLWKSNVPHLPANREMAIKRLESLGKNFQKNPDFAKLYHDQARQLTKEEAKYKSAITNYIPHHEQT